MPQINRRFRDALVGYYLPLKDSRTFQRKRKETENVQSTPHRHLLSPILNANQAVPSVPLDLYLAACFLLLLLKKYHFGQTSVIKLF